ncbi:MAG: putative microcompartment shellprotein [Peptococcaceae bacterium]|jgi:microcompartment protein CcmL/EutN|nr:putative microcompartment shellprotein [Peptococcaceae bacterium]
MSQNALGLVEVIGLTAAIEAADTCLKSANVQLIGYEKVTKGLVTVKIQGDVGAVKAAIEAAKSSVAQIGTVVSTLIIPRPAAALQLLVESETTIGLQRGDSRSAGVSEAGGGIPEPGRSDKTVDWSDEPVEEGSFRSDGPDEPLDKLSDGFVKEPSDQSVERPDKPSDKLADDPVEKPEADDQVPVKLCSTDRAEMDEFASLDVIRAANDLEQEVDTTVRMDKGEQGEGFTLREKDSVCNLCHDPLCPREKGQPRILCIHSKQK